MTEEFVTFKLAEKLKEKGYNKPFYFYYRTDDELIHHVNTCDPLVYSDKIDDEVVIAPTISQVLNWLRKEKKILVVAAPAFLYREARYFWQCGIYEISLLPNVIPFHKFIDNQESRESALLAGIEYAINNLI